MRTVVEEMRVGRLAPHRALVLVAFLVLLGGCPGALAALTAVAQGAQWLGAVLDAADVGQRAYYARHPNVEAQQRVEQAMRRARLALAALDGLLAAGQAVDQQELQRARQEAVGAYEALRELLGELGVLEARAPAGGAETEAPAPEPLPLPAADLVRARL